MTPLTKTFLAVFIAGLSGIIVDFCNFNLRGIALPSTVIFFGLILVRFALEKIAQINLEQAEHLQRLQCATCGNDQRI